MLDKKSRVEVALQNSRCQIVQGPTGGCAAADGFEHAIQIEPRLVTIEQTLADTHHRAGDHDPVPEFRLLSSAGPCLMPDLFPQSFEQRQPGLHISRIPSAHDREVCML